MTPDEIKAAIAEALDRYRTLAASYNEEAEAEAVLAVVEPLIQQAEERGYEAAYRAGYESGCSAQEGLDYQRGRGDERAAILRLCERAYEADLTYAHVPEMVRAGEHLSPEQPTPERTCATCDKPAESWGMCDACFAAAEAVADREAEPTPEQVQPRRMMKTLLGWQHHEQAHGDHFCAAQGCVPVTAEDETP